MCEGAVWKKKTHSQVRWFNNHFLYRKLHQTNVLCAANVSTVKTGAVTTTTQ